MTWHTDYTTPGWERPTPRRATYAEANYYLMTLQSNRLDIGQALSILDSTPTLLARIRAEREHTP